MLHEENVQKNKKAEGIEIVVNISEGGDFVEFDNMENL